MNIKNYQLVFQNNKTMAFLKQRLKFFLLVFIIMVNNLKKNLNKVYRDYGN